MAFTGTIRTPSNRAKNHVLAQTATVTSDDGKRRVTFRNAKRNLGFVGGYRQYDIVRVAQLKTIVDGKWRVIASGRSEEAGKAFLRGEDVI